VTPPHRRSRSSTRLGGGLAAAVGALAVALTVVQPRRLRLREERLALPGWPRDLDGLRIAVLGDLHAGGPWVGLAKVREVVARTRAARPDLVLLLGDHLADVGLGRHLPVAPVAAELAGLRRDGAPVVGVLGNHDWYAGGEQVRAALTAVGLPVLEESTVPVLDGRLWVAGVGDLWERTPSVATALADVPAGSAVVLLTHNPDCVVDVPEQVQLVLAGHTHGGQVAVRGRPLHQVSERTGNRWRRGWYAGARMYVTSGVGSSVVPLRSVVPEVVVLELRTQ